MTTANAISLWAEHEPRLHFPVFKDKTNFVEMTIQPATASLFRQLSSPAYYWLKKKKPARLAVRDYFNFLLNRPYKFRGAFFNQTGQCIHNETFEGKFRRGELFGCNVNEMLASAGIEMCDGTFALISSRGRPDLLTSSPGNATLRVEGHGNVAGYRTGFFCRTLNAGKKHYGFTGLNPQVEIKKDKVASLLFINHSSDPNYKTYVRPNVKLFKNTGDFIEADFGQIPPHAAIERRLDELFPTGAEFLAETGGKGHTITQVQGATLASMHLLRDHSGELLAIEHSRPSFTNIVSYL